jgi:predicted nucleic acid-binding protein
MNLIVDANVLVSAVLGRSMPLFAEVASRASILFVPLRMMIETQHIVADVTRLKVPDGLIRFALLTEFVTILEPEIYDDLEPRARERLDVAGQSDWSVLASALATGASIWSNDKHFRGVGVAVWATRNIRFWNVEALA